MLKAISQATRFFANKALVGFAVCLLFASVDALAETDIALDSDSLPVVKRAKVNGAAFMRSDDVYAKYYSEQLIRGSSKLIWDTRVYIPRPGKKIEKKNEFNAMPPVPTCQEPKLRRQPVYHKSSGAELMDVVFFNASSVEQSNQARNVTVRIAPYLQKPKTAQEQLWSSFALEWGVACLPTRFHFVDEQGKRFIEYREGSFAWQ